MERKEQSGKRILILHWMDPMNPKSGGDVKYFHEMAKRLCQDNYSITWISSKHAELSPSERLDGFKIIRFGNIYTVFVYGFLYSLIKWKDYDIVVESISAIPFFAPRLRRKKIAMIHHIVDRATLKERLGFLFPAGYFVQNMLSPFLYKNVSVITNSHSSAKEIREIGYRKVSVVKMGIVLPPEEIGFDFKKNFIICPGPLRPWKRVDHVIRAFSCAAKDWKLIIFGDFLNSEYENIIRGLLKEVGIDNRTEVLGYITEDEKNRLYSASKICLIASKKEGWGLSAFEPQAYSCITVAFNVPGISESVIDGKTGILVEDGDLKSLCEIVGRLTSNQRTIEQLSKNCYRRVSCHSWTNCYDDFKQAIEAL